MDKILKFKPSGSINPPSIKYDGWFSCGGHCACNDCYKCVLEMTQKEAENNAGCHFYE